MYGDIHTGIGSAILTVAALTMTLWRLVSRHRLGKSRAIRLQRKA
ncbi:MAG TPA: hypothetical protein VFQ44_07060 [Streptosporangiaceae bacterium]|nr:hypothetical protein [Streptosporangiaceae bacterium]